MIVATSRSCAACGRRMTNRRRWARNREQVRYRSRACRRRKVGARRR